MNLWITSVQWCTSVARSPLPFTRAFLVNFLVLANNWHTASSEFLQIKMVAKSELLKTAITKTLLALA